MKKYIVTIVITALLFTVFGWTAAASQDYYSVLDHKDSSVQPSGGAVVADVKTYQGIKTAILTFIKNGREKCYLNIIDYDGSISDAVSEASLEIIHNTSLGAFAVENITHSFTKELTYYNVEVDIYYKHTREQIQGILYLNYISAVQGALGKAITDHNGYLVLSISSELVTPDYLKAYALEYYRGNPSTVLAMPTITTNVYQPQGMPKILEIEMGFPYTAQNESDMRTRMQNTVAMYLKNQKGSNDLTTAANACRRLISVAVFLNSGSADAYNTIIYGLGNSEGLAMSYKVFCNTLGIRCTVVEGTQNGVQRFWNIIEINGEYYHVDPALCSSSGIAAGFLKSDVDMTALDYHWDITKYNACRGSLKYEATNNG